MVITVVPLRVHPFREKNPNQSLVGEVDIVKVTQIDCAVSGLYMAGWLAGTGWLPAARQGTSLHSKFDNLFLPPPPENGSR